MAGWQNGDAAACKAVYAGSIPASASRFFMYKEQKYDEIDLVPYLRTIFVRLKFILLISFIFFSLWFLYFLNVDRIYNVKSLVLVESNRSSVANSSIDFSSILSSGSESSNTNVESQMILYKARSNILELITSLNLNIKFQENNLNFKRFYIHEDEPGKGYKNFTIITNSNDTYDLVDQDGSLIVSSISYDQRFINEKYEIELSKPNIKDINHFSFSYTDPSNLIDYYQNIIILQELKTAPNNFYANNGGFFNSSININDPKKGIQIIDKANEIFIRENIELKNLKANFAIDFIDERLLNLEEIISRDNLNLNNFLKENASINVDLEIKEIIERLSGINEKIYELEIEQSNLQQTYTSSNPVYQNILNQKNILLEEKKKVSELIKKLPESQREYIELYRDLEVSQDVFTELTNKKLEYSILAASSLSNIRVINSAYETGKVSPVAFYGIVVAFIGFLFGCFYALVVGLFFSKILNPAEIENTSIKVPYVGILPFFKDDTEKLDYDSNFQRSLESTLLNIRMLDEKDAQSKKILLQVPRQAMEKHLSHNQLL